ncbi:MAG: CPBP family intramembrane metalloprotease [Deltaproteobacteria bacterium]|nr:CPBP family intramembrane metalloprotease [Deltaproteobacteria bacterium]
MTHRILRHLFSFGQTLPGLPTVFLTVAALSLLQIPMSWLSLSVSLSVGILLNEILLIAGLPLGISWWRRFDFSQLFRWTRPSWSQVFLALMFIVGVDIVIDYFTAITDILLPLPEAERGMLEKALEVTSLWQLLEKTFLIVFLPAICEEIFFRGYCQTSFEKHVGRTLGILLTGFIFAFLHGNPWYFHLYLLLGMALSWVYSVTLTLWIPILCHAVNNAWTFYNHLNDVAFPLQGFTSSLDVGLFFVGIVLIVVTMKTFSRAYPRRESFH